MSTWETSKRFEWDYAVNLIGGEYYVIDSQGLLMAREALASDAIEAAIAAAGHNGAVIKLHPDLDADGETVTINKSNISLVSLNPKQLTYDTWATPRITKVLLTPDDEALKNTMIYGLNMREVEMQAGVAGHNYNIGHVFLEKCHIECTDTAGQRGIRFTSGGESEDYIYFFWMTDCVIRDHFDQSGIDRGAISIESAHDGNGQYWFTRLDYKPFVNNCTLFAVPGRCIMVNVTGMSHVNLVRTGLKLFHLPGTGRATDFRVSDSLFEEHVAMTMFDVDNAAPDSIDLLVDFSHNMFSLTSAQTVTFINNGAANGDWIDGVCDGILGHMNRIKSNPASLVLGTPAVGSRFMFNVEFIEEVTEDFVPVVRGGPLRWYSFSTGADTIDQNPDYLNPGKALAASATAADVQWLVPADGYVSNLDIVLSTAPVVGHTWTFTFREDAGVQAVAVAITGAATTGSDTTNSFEVDKGDLLDIICTKTNAPAATRVYGTWAFQQKLP